MLECSEDMNASGQNSERINADLRQIEIDPQSNFEKGRDAEAVAFVTDLNERDK